MGYSIYKTGSRSLPFLKNVHDLDIIVYVDSLGETSKLDLEIRRFGQNADIKYKLVPNWKKKDMEIFDYQYHFIQYIEGREIDFSTYDIFTRKEEYIECLWRCFNRIKDTSKRMYHILVGVYMLENNSYDLTEEQADNVQLAHDNQCPEDCVKHIEEFFKRTGRIIEMVE